MNTFTPFASLIGGILIGLSASLLLLLHGRIAGISSIVGESLKAPRDDFAWRLLFLAGLVGGGAIAAFMVPAAFPATLSASPRLLVVSGLLVGIGTRLGKGCTSGHGVCGLGRLSKRSLVATAVFMMTAAVTVFVFRHLLGGAR
jgi:uncharacterized membrane protein YedE/YeeE